ncbi:hypothetical protein ACFQVA_12705 [Actinomadura keratinilytica]
MDQRGQATLAVDRTVTYQEDPPRTWTRICLAAYALWAAYQAFQLLPDELTAWLVVCAMSLLLLLCLLAVPLSKRLYHRIRLADGELRVGRERLAVASLTPVSLTAAAANRTAPACASTAPPSPPTSSRKPVAAPTPSPGRGWWAGRGRSRSAWRSWWWRRWRARPWSSPRGTGRGCWGR